MQEKRDAGEDGYNTRMEGFRFSRRGIHDWKDTRKEGEKERRYSGEEGCRTGGMQ